MSNPVLVLLMAQVIFSAGDLLARYKMKLHGFNMANILSLWFLVFFATNFIAVMMQLYVFASVELGRTITLLAVSGIIFSNITGLLFLHEVLSLYAYIGVFLAIGAFLFLALNRV